MASFRNIQFGTKKAFGTAEPLTPDAFGDPPFCPKQRAIRFGERIIQWREEGTLPEVG